MKSLKYFLSLIVITMFLSCGPQFQYYKKEYSAEEKIQLSKQLIDGRGWYYQGTPSEQLVFEEAKKLDPNNADAYRELGVPYLKRGFAAEYGKYYSEAIKLDPDTWQGWRGYLYLYFYRDYKNAIKDFDATDILTPDFVDYPQAMSVNYMRGICYMMLEDFDRALEYFDGHIEMEKELTGLKYMESPVFLFKGICHFNKEEYVTALEAINTAIEIDPMTADQYFWKAKVLNKIGQSDTGEIEALLDKSAALILKGNANHRPYVEEFYQTYTEDVIEFRHKITSSL